MNQIRRKIEGLFKEFVGIREAAEAENRALTEKDKAERAKLQEEIQRLVRSIDPGANPPSGENALRGFLYGDEPGSGARTMETGNLGSNNMHSRNAASYELRGPNDKKDYRSLFGDNAGATWTDKNIDFFRAVFSGRHHPDLDTRAMTIGSPSDGGFLIPVQYASQIHAVSLENEIIMPKCFVQPMISNECKIPAMAIGSHFTDLFGGFIATYKGETAELEEKNPKTRSMTLTARKLTGLLRFSNEFAQDTPGGEQQIVNLCGQGLAWYRDKAFLKGNGAGQPLGILSANCTIEVEPETGQGAEIVYANLTKMMAAMYAGSFKNSVWICHQSTIPSLLTLSIPIGTGGDHIPVMTRANGGFEILTRPVLFTEKTETLGERGDIILADLSQYVVGLRGDMRFDLSPHKYFTSDELLARIIERHDGQPLWDQPLTLEDGSTQVSPFVTLAAR